MVNREVWKVCKLHSLTSQAITKTFLTWLAPLKHEMLAQLMQFPKPVIKKKCPIFFPWGYVLPSNFSPDDETAKKNSSEKKGSIIVAKLHFLCGFSVSKQTKSAQSYSHKLYEFYCAVTIKGIGNQFMLVRLVKRI